MTDVKCENARHCLHYWGTVRGGHGRFLPENTPSERQVFRCCDCGRYQDTRGLEVQVEVREEAHA